MDDISELVIKNVVSNETYCRTVLPFLKMEYFEGHSKFVFNLVAKFVTKYNALPNCSSMEYEFSQLESHPENAQAIHDYIRRVFTIEEDDKKVDPHWLLETTEKWCKDRAVYLAVIKSIEIINGSNTTQTPAALPDILSQALSVTFDRSVGHDYTQDGDARFNYYHTIEDKIPCDLDLFNKITNGGVTRKTLNVLLGGTGAGKSMVLCHLASSYLSRGSNVLYITLEMSEEKIAERIDANLMDIKIQDLGTLTKSSFISKLASIRSKSSGKLIIKEYPTAAAHAGHFRALIEELKLKKDFKPDVIIIDYINICSSSRIKAMGGSIGSYGYVKAIAEELRGLAIETETAMWSATQTNRDGMNSSDVEITNTSESFGLPATADLMLAIITTEELEELEQMLIKQLKNRYNDISYYRRFILGMDRSKMRLYDAEESAQAGVMPEPTAKTNFTSKIADDGENSFADFKL